ncbi:MAG: hypothetical protein ACR2LS_10035, partial [Thermomicrobiales bacterium]
MCPPLRARRGAPVSPWRIGRRRGPIRDRPVHPHVLLPGDQPLLFEELPGDRFRLFAVDID